MKILLILSAVVGATLSMTGFDPTAVKAGQFDSKRRRTTMKILFILSAVVGVTLPATFFDPAAVKGDHCFSDGKKLKLFEKYYPPGKCEVQLCAGWNGKPEALEFMTCGVQTYQIPAELEYEIVQDLLLKYPDCCPTLQIKNNTNSEPSESENLISVTV